jgi:YesN/AraC family two-component response regulator
MVSARCIKILQLEFERTNAIKLNHIQLGAVDIEFDKSKISLLEIDNILIDNGFERIIDKDFQLTEQIKVAVLEMIYYGNNLNTIIRNSDYLSDKLGSSYSHLSKVFSEKTNYTLEKYIILVRIERVKELISYGELTLSEIAYMMGYSSVQYLSNQFKQVTGYSVTDYKSLPIKPRKALDKLID